MNYKQIYDLTKETQFLTNDERCAIDSMFKLFIAREAFLLHKMYVSDTYELSNVFAIVLAFASNIRNHDLILPDKLNRYFDSLVVDLGAPDQRLLKKIRFNYNMNLRYREQLIDYISSLDYIVNLRHTSDNDMAFSFDTNKI